MSPVFGYHYSSRQTPIPSGHPVCVAVTFNPKGDMRLDAFGVEINHLRYRYKIKSVKSIKDKPGMRFFECEYIDFGRLKILNFVYYIADHRWTVA